MMEAVLKFNFVWEKRAGKSENVKTNIWNHVNGNLLPITDEGVPNGTASTLTTRKIRSEKP